MQTLLTQKITSYFAEEYNTGQGGMEPQVDLPSGKLIKEGSPNDRVDHALSSSTDQLDGTIGSEPQVTELLSSPAEVVEKEFYPKSIIGEVVSDGSVDVNRVVTFYKVSCPSHIF